MKLSFLFFIFLPLIVSAHDSEISLLAKRLNLSAGSKAIVQWERVFKSTRKMKKYKIDTLTNEKKEMLKEYLIQHAIDSDQPTIAGI